MKVPGMLRANRSFPRHERIKDRIAYFFETGEELSGGSRRDNIQLTGDKILPSVAISEEREPNKWLSANINFIRLTFEIFACLSPRTMEILKGSANDLLSRNLWFGFPEMAFNVRVP
ncbi:hypothetical protein QE152_g35584 [Popillia japonica]|uniref:Uncharacterized protein n=1 Tax=Popillia japonica TaxID=7064 RepID=A0AAW1IFI7_POPJA